MWFFKKKRPQPTPKPSPLTPALAEEIRSIFTAPQVDQEKARQFFTRCKSMPEDQQCAVGYELAKLGVSNGHGSLSYRGRYYAPMACLPFRFFGWAGCPPHNGGIAFQINRRCFSDEDPLLFYEGPLWQYGIAPAAVVQESSRGIQVVRYEKGRLEFRLTAGSLDALPPLKLQGRTLPMTEVGEPVIQLPIDDEFACAFGEVTNEGDVILHRDDFCMK